MMMMLSLSSASSLSVVVYYRATGSPLRRSLYILMTVAFISFALICQSSFRVESIKRHMESMAGVSVEDEEDGTVKWVKEGRQDAFSNAPPKQQLRYHATHLTIPSLRRIPSFGASKSHPSVTEETDSKPKLKKESSTANQQAVAFPPLESLVLPTNATKEQFRQGPPPYPSDEHYIVGNVSGLLDFAILGHAKTASTYLSRWFSEHPDMLIWEDEVCDLYNMMPAQLVRRLYNEFPKNTNTQTYQRGFKCPGHFSQRSMAYFSRFFHKTKLIVGVRHPVRWFESYYNFRSRHKMPGKGNLPDPLSMLRQHCTVDMQGVCTKFANFHSHLSVFGKTNMSNPAEMSLLGKKAGQYNHIEPIDNPIFLYDMGQLGNDSMIQQFKLDLQAFLQLPKPLTDDYAAIAKKTHRVNKLRRIDICEKQYKPLRDELVGIGRKASKWIRSYFLHSPQVFLSNREQFISLVREWETDPCNGSALKK